jgi:transaldolase
MNALKELKNAGQSVWLDYLSRDIIKTGKLGRMVDEGVSGVTSNPTIFQKAMEGTDVYDEQLRQLKSAGVKDGKELFLALAMKDVSDAADILLPVYEAEEGGDGFVSIEVSPDLAHDTQATIEEALRLFREINRKNVMVKVPATREGLPAIERLTAEGVNVNVTLLFSVKRYEEVARAYMRGIEGRVRSGLPVDGISSVASFFVSRVDTLVDSMLDERSGQAGHAGDKEIAKKLYGKAAVANARIAYRRFRELYSGPDFSRQVKDNRAGLQRLLWGSTGTKNPSYSDIKYVEELVGRHTVNTMPEKTMTAFKDHGVVRLTVEEGLDEADSVIHDLGSMGIDIERVAEELEKDGVKKFTDSYMDVLEKTANKIV